MSEPTTTRRNALRTIAATVGVTTVGAGALYGIDEAMGAHVSGTYTFTDPDALVNDTGDLEWVRVAASTDIHWTGFEVSVDYVGFTELIEVYDAAGNIVAGPHRYLGLELIEGAPAFHDADDLVQADPNGTQQGNVGGPYALDGENQQAGTTGHIVSGDDPAQIQVLIADGGDGSDAEADAAGDSVVDTVPLDADDVFEPESDGGTKTTTIRKTEYAHLYTENDGPDLLHPENDYAWAPGPAVVSGTFDVVVENIESDTSESSGDGTGESG